MALLVKNYSNGTLDVPPRPGLAVLGRKGETHAWLSISRGGVATTLFLSKHDVVSRTGVPLRDLRLLEAGLTTRHVRGGQREVRS